MTKKYNPIDAYNLNFDGSLWVSLLENDNQPFKHALKSTKISEHKRKE